MTKRSWFLAAFGAAVFATCLGLPFIPSATQPFDTYPAPSDKFALQIHTSSVGLTMPEGLQPGDIVHFSDMTPAVRSYFMVGSSNPPVGSALDMPVRRADGLHHVETTFQRVPYLNGSLASQAYTVANYALLLLMSALGLLLLWRGQGRATLGVAIWCFAGTFQTFAAAVPLPLPYCALFAWSGNLVQALGTLVGLYLVADGLTASGRPPLRRRQSHWLFTAVVLLYAAWMTYFNVTLYLTGILPALGAGYIRVIHLAGFAIPLAILVFAYRPAASLDQARIRWILFSLSGQLLAYAMSTLIGPLVVGLGIPPLALFLTMTAAQAASFTGFTYALLKHRLVSLQVVLNRALVYGLVTSLVVGVFAAMLSFLEHTALNSETNRVAVLAVILLLGMGLDTMKRKVNDYIGKIFFRKRRQAEAALAQFARSAGHVDDPEKLLDLTADELFRQSAPMGLAIYLTAPGVAGASLTRQRGEGSYPKRLDSNDLAFLRLKAGDLELDVHGVGSALGDEGMLYALSIRNQVLGFIALGPRPAESYTAEERRLFELVARQVAVALHALRLDEQKKLLGELAAGGFPNLPAAQAKAKALVEAASI